MFSQWTKKTNLCVSVPVIPEALRVLHVSGLSGHDNSVCSHLRRLVPKHCVHLFFYLKACASNVCFHFIEFSSFSIDVFLSVLLCSLYS